jgi:hypothetical protein
MMTLEQAKRELERHSLDTYLTESPAMGQGGRGVVMTGCPACRKNFQSINQLMRHLADDVLPVIFGVREPGEEAALFSMLQSLEIRLHRPNCDAVPLDLALDTVRSQCVIHADDDKVLASCGQKSVDPPDPIRIALD